MTGLVALGYMLVEEGKIVAIRNLHYPREVTYSSVTDFGLPLNFERKATGWQIGFPCSDCCGTGESTTRDRWDNVVDCACPSCDAGIRWQKEY